jgi:hypothetical protein
MQRAPDLLMVEHVSGDPDVRDREYMYPGNDLSRWRGDLSGNDHVP